MTPVPPPRLAPNRPFPVYAYVPGRTEHPHRNPEHLFHREPAGPVVPLDPAAWQTNEAYLYGLDLFNEGFCWEAHEIWEGLWHAAGRRGMTADFLKGLIRLAAAGVKHHEGRPAGVKSHSARAAELWRQIVRSPPSEPGILFGFRPGDLIELAEAIARNGWPTETPHLRPVFPEG